MTLPSVWYRARRDSRQGLVLASIFETHRACKLLRAKVGETSDSIIDVNLYNNTWRDAHGQRSVPWLVAPRSSSVDVVLNPLLCLTSVIPISETLLLQLFKHWFGSCCCFSLEYS